jgi:hypothetical protein
MGRVLKEFAEGERGLRLFGKLYEVACRGRRPSVTRVVNTRLPPKMATFSASLLVARPR